MISEFLVCWNYLEDGHAEVVDFYLVTVETEFGEAFCFVSNTTTHVPEENINRVL